MPQEKTVASLTADERLALVALIERVLLSERSADDEEAAALDAFVEEFGEADYAAQVARADSDFEDDDRFKALVEGVQTGEAEWIGWASEAWNVPVSVTGPEPQE
jgi:hypothetical protein